MLERDDNDELYPIAEKTGYSFDAWLDAEGNPLSTESLVQDKTYYASYVDDIAPEISFTTSKDVAASQTIEISASDAGSGVAGYYFGTEDPLNSEVLFETTNTSVAASAGTYYYAAIDNDGNIASNIVRFHLLTLNLNGGTLATDSILFDEGATVTLPEPEKTGYSGVWMEDATSEVVSEVVVDGEKSFSVQWSPNSYQVCFDANGSTCDADPRVVVFGTAYGELPTPANRNGYQFIGWFTEKTGGTQILADSQMVFAENHSLYAQWKYTHVHSSGCYKTTTTTCGQRYSCIHSNTWTASMGGDWPVGTECWSHTCPNCGGGAPQPANGGWAHSNCGGGTCSNSTTTTTKICGLP